MRAVRYDFDEIPNLAPRDNNGPIMTCSRTAVANMTDIDGWWREVQADEARFQGCTWNQNLMGESDDLGDFTNVRATRTTGHPDPFGGNNAALVSEDGTVANSHYIDAIGTPVYPLNAEVMNTVFLKPINRDWVLLSVDNLGVGGVDINFNMSTGEFGTIGADINQYDVTTFADGWYRVRFTHTTAGDAVGNTRIFIAESDNDTTFDGLNQDSFYAYGYQIIDVSGAWLAQNHRDNSDRLGGTISTGEADWLSGGVADPFGGFNAGTFLVTGAGNPRIFDIANTGSSVGSSLIMSHYAKAGKGTSISNPLFQGIDITANFTLTDDGTAEIVSGTGSVGIERIGYDGWYRCWAEGVITNANLARTFFRVADAEEVVDNTMYFFGNQYEYKKPNQTRPSEYVSVPLGVFGVNKYPSFNYLSTGTNGVTALNGKPEGLRREQARTNICLQSRAIDVGPWGSARAAITTDIIVGLDGNLTGHKLEDDGTLGPAGAVYILQAVTVDTATTYNFSAVLKKDQVDWAYLEIQGFTTPVNSTAFFDLANSLEGTIDAGFDNSKIEDLGNGWHRCAVSFTTDAADTTGNIFIGVATANGVKNITRDGTNSIFIWQVDLTEGLFPSTPIYTQGISVTRDVDVIENIDSGYDFHNSDNGEMSVYLECIPDADGGDMAFGYGLVNISTNGGLSGLQMYDQSAGVTLRMTYWNGGLQGNTAPGSDTLDDFCKGNVTNRFAVGVQQDNMVATCYFGDTGDQGLSVKDTSMNVITGSPLDSIRIGRESSTGIDGIYQKIHVFDKRLSDKQLLVMGRGPRPPILPGGRAEKTRRANDAALWNKMMNARTEDDSDGEYKPWANIG